MARRGRLAGAVLLVAAVVAVAALVTVAVVGGRGGEDARAEAVAAAEAFLDTYVDDDGRVVRTDQGGDTVSEGQAYGMLLSAGLADEARFRSIWSWTAANLRRADGLLAWRWADGAVVDDGPATDADLIAAGALVLAGRRFDDPSLVTAGRSMSAAILAAETVAVGSATVLVAGPWATAQRVVNPSYFVVALMSLLHDAGEVGWQPVAATSRRLLDDLTATAPSLVPDWATVAPDGASITAGAAPGGAEAQSGYEAGRAYVQLAVDCRPAGQAIAARAWPFLADEAAHGDDPHAAYRLDGTPLTPASHPLAMVAAAASAAAAGHAAAAEELLDRADDLDARHPTYYGSAWVAIGRLWLDTELLGGCRPGAPAG